MNNKKREIGGEKMIELHNVSKTYTRKGTNTEALKNINLKVNKGDIFGVIGYSGAGKSTLVRLVNYLEKPTDGTVVVNRSESTRLNSSHVAISYAVFCLKKK